MLAAFSKYGSASAARELTFASEDPRHCIDDRHLRRALLGVDTLYISRYPCFETLRGNSLAGLPRTLSNVNYRDSVKIRS